MRRMLKYLIPLVPALVLFGPIFMVIGYGPSTHMWAIIGALMTGLGIIIMFLKIIDQSKQIGELSK